MKNLKVVLDFLSGKKSAIAGVVMTVVAYLASRAILGEAEVVLIGGVVTILFGGASYATGKLIYKK